jgi:protocatechuate 3,4-dioxygenase, beta subunit
MQHTRLGQLALAPCIPRRRLLRGLTAAALAAASPLAGAAALIATPAQGKGPFYPLELPLDRDNDLVHVAGQSGTAVGTVIDVVGQLLDEQGHALSGVQIEIWQVNGYGRYHNPRDEQDKPWDPNFQGFGRTVTDAQGAYRFRTVRPVAYPGRAPHIHFALSDSRFATFYTQMYLAGAPENARDFLLTSVRDRQARDRLIVALQPSSEQGAEQVGRFDIVLGRTLLSREP